MFVLAFCFPVFMLGVQRGEATPSAGTLALGVGLDRQLVDRPEPVEHRFVGSPGGSDHRRHLEEERH